MKIYLGSKAKHLSIASDVRNLKTRTPNFLESKIKSSRHSERFEARKAAEIAAKNFLLSSYRSFHFTEDLHWFTEQDRLDLDSSHYADAEDDWQDPPDDPAWPALDYTPDEFQYLDD